ncbi:hypothetical protein ACFL2O_01620 [Thermodesulfobacteriota bacterium]
MGHRRVWSDYLKNKKNKNHLKIKLSLINYWNILRLKNVHAGEQCIVVLGGPSVNETNFDLFADHPFVMGVNGAYLKRNNFKYYFCSSLNFYEPNKKDIQKVKADLLFFSSQIPFKLSRKIIYLLLDTKRPLWKQSETDLEFNLFKNLPWGPTVLLDLVIPVSLWMGFSEIILVGADYSTTAFKRFYDDQEDGPQRIRKTDNESEMAKAHLSMNKLSKYLKNNKKAVKIYNCSPLSELTQFPKPPLEDVINKHTNRP